MRIVGLNPDIGFEYSYKPQVDNRTVLIIKI